MCSCHTIPRWGRRRARSSRRSTSPPPAISSPLHSALLVTPEPKRRIVTATPRWQISGEYFEACSCDSVCPCPTSDIAVAGIAGANPNEPIYFDNVRHPAASRLALAKATRSHLHAFGIDWDDESGRNNGHFAPFSWSAS